MNFPPYRISAPCRALKAFEGKTGLCATACVEAGEVGQVTYYWNASQKFIVEWPGVRNHPQIVHAAADWDVIVGAVEEKIVGRC